MPRLLIPPMLGALDTTSSRVLGTHYHVPTVEALDARLRTLLGYLAKLNGRPDLAAKYRVDLEDLLLRRLWLTMPVDPDAREHCDQQGSPGC